MHPNRKSNVAATLQTKDKKDQHNTERLWGIKDNTGVSDLKITYKNKTITRFDIVNTSPRQSSSILGCRQTQELGIISVSLNEIKRQSTTGREMINKKELLEKYKTCFNKIGCFPREEISHKIDRKSQASDTRT